MFGFAGPIIDVLEKGYTLFIDELDVNLHPKLVEFIVKLFNSKENNPNNAQLVFTSHDVYVLDQNNFRRDQIWFCEKMIIKLQKFIPCSSLALTRKR